MLESATPAASGQVEDARIAAARALLPLVRQLFQEAKRQADAIDRTERRFGTPAIMHLARLLDDLWMAADNLICDLDEAL